jgi:hypothetical protein
MTLFPDWRLAGEQCQTLATKILVAKLSAPASNPVNHK